MMMVAWHINGICYLEKDAFLSPRTLYFFSLQKFLEKNLLFSGSDSSDDVSRAHFFLMIETHFILFPQISSFHLVVVVVVVGWEALRF